MLTVLYAIEFCNWNLHIVQQHYFMSFGGYVYNLT